jgi:hypothetical protein
MRINARTKVITILFDGRIREVVISIGVVRVLSPRRVHGPLTPKLIVTPVGLLRTRSRLPVTGLSCAATVRWYLCTQSLQFNLFR